MYVLTSKKNLKRYTVFFRRLRSIRAKFASEHQLQMGNRQQTLVRYTDSGNISPVSTIFCRMAPVSKNKKDESGH